MNKTTLKIKGLASGKIVKELTIPYPLENNPSLSLMKFLISNGITIASSCSGVGGCHKCLVNQTLLSCQISLFNFVQKNPQLEIEIAYL